MHTSRVSGVEKFIILPLDKYENFSQIMVLCNEFITYRRKKKDRMTHKF